MNSSLWKKPVVLGACIVSLVWIGLALDYLSQAGWWSHRYELAPAEFVGTLLSQCLPLALIWFVVVWILHKKQLQEETQMLQNYMQQLMFPTEEGAAYTQALTSTLRDQIKEFKKVFALVAEQSQNMRTDLRTWLQELARIIDHADKHTLTSIRQMARHVQILAKSMEKANATTQEVTQSLQMRSTILQKAADNTVQTAAQITALLAKNKEQIEAVTHTVLTSVDRAQEGLGQARTIAQAFAANNQGLDAILTRYEADTQQCQERLSNNAQQLIHSVQEQGRILEAETDKLLGRLTTAQTQTLEQAQQVQSHTDQALQQLNKFNTQISLQAENIQQSVDGLEEHLSILQKTDLAPQLDQLKKISQEAAKHISATKDNLDSLQLDSFMTDARLILSHLSQFSIDMTHIFSPKAEEGLWKKYYAGDVSAFMRHLLTALSKEKRDKLQKLYQTDTSYRIAVTRYLAEFDAFSAKIQTNGKKELLLPLLVGSDAGRLYMILKQCHSAPTTKGGAS